MSAAESLPVDHAASLPKPSLEPEKRIHVRDLPTPPELLPAIEDYARRYGGWFWRARERRSRRGLSARAANTSASRYLATDRQAMAACCANGRSARSWTICKGSSKPSQTNAVRSIECASITLSHARRNAETSSSPCRLQLTCSK